MFCNCDYDCLSPIYACHRFFIYNKIGKQNLLPYLLWNNMIIILLFPF